MPLPKATSSIDPGPPLRQRARQETGKPPKSMCKQARNAIAERGQPIVRDDSGGMGRWRWRGSESLREMGGRRADCKSAGGALP